LARHLSLQGSQLGRAQSAGRGPVEVRLIPAPADL